MQQKDEVSEEAQTVRTNTTTLFSLLISLTVFSSDQERGDIEFLPRREEHRCLEVLRQSMLEEARKVARRGAKGRLEQFLQRDQRRRRGSMRCRRRDLRWDLKWGMGTKTTKGN